MWVSNGVVPSGENRANTGSDIAVVDERVLAAAVPAARIETLNVTKSTKVHVGTKVVSITQNVQNKETLKELPLRLYLWNIIKNSSRTERLSSVAALVVLVICISLIVYFTVKSVNGDPIDRDNDEWNITRDKWLARPFTSNNISKEFLPLMLVVVQHTVSSQCVTIPQCAAELRNIQNYFINGANYDIPYNFLVGNDGRIYEGRGWNIEGAHTYRYNRCTLGIGFIGDYREKLPSHARVTPTQLKRTRMLLDEGVRLGYLRPDFQIVGAKDLQPGSESPGSNLHNALKLWNNYDHQNRFKNMNCEEIQEKYGNVDLS